MIDEVVLVFGMFCVTYFIRYIPLGLSNNFKLPFYFEKGLKYVPTAVLMAITSLAIFTQDDGNLNFNLTYSSFKQKFIMKITSMEKKDILTFCRDEGFVVSIDLVQRVLKRTLTVEEFDL